MYEQIKEKSQDTFNCQGIYSSKELKNLARAMAKAQGNIKAAVKDESNPYFKSNYATLASVYSACRDELSSNGIAIFQHAHNGEGGSIIITTRIVHGESGEWMQSSVRGKPAKEDIQGIGSVISYLRRYSLSTMIGVATEDDDGNAAVKQNGKKAEELVTVDQATELEKLFKEEPEYRKQILLTLKIKAFTDLPKKHYVQVKNAIELKKAQDKQPPAAAPKEKK